MDHERDDGGPGTPGGESPPGTSPDLLQAAFGSLLRRSGDFLLLLDPACRILSASASYAGAVSDDDDLAGGDFLATLDPGRRGKALAFLGAARDRSPAVELALRAPDGAARLASFTFCRFAAPDGTHCIAALGREQEVALRLVDRVIGLNRELEEARRELERRADTDPLTGSGNRRWLFERLDALWAEGSRRGALAWMVMADLDHFKKINDTYGHHAGDEALKATAAALRGAVRADDLVARYGGEEFVLAGPCRDGRELLRVTQRLLATVRSLRVEIPGQSLRLTASLGAVLAVRGPACSPSLALRVADAAAYRAKARGRDRCEIEPGVLGRGDEAEVPGTLADALAAARE